MLILDGSFMGELSSPSEDSAHLETTLLWRPIKGNLSNIYRTIGLTMKFNVEDGQDDYFRISSFLFTLGHIGRGMDEFRRLSLKGELGLDGTLEIPAEDLLEDILNQANTALPEERKGNVWERDVLAAISLVNWLSGKEFKIVFEFKSDDDGVDYSEINNVFLERPI